MFKKFIVFIMIFSLMVFNIGCGKNISMETTNPPLLEQSETAYQAFLSEFKKENLDEKGIDIKKIVDCYMVPDIEPVRMEYTIDKLTLVDNDEGDPKDLLIQININNGETGLDKTIICLFVFTENDTFINVFSQSYFHAKYEIINVLGTQANQVLLITDNSGNSHTIETIQCLSYNSNLKDMEVIFEEYLTGYSFLPYKKTLDNDFYSVSFVNEYKFVAGANEAKDILFTSTIFEKEDEILESGESRFFYNGEKYITTDYYDYQMIARKIYDLKD